MNSETKVLPKTTPTSFYANKLSLSVPSQAGIYPISLRNLRFSETGVFDFLRSCALPLDHDFFHERFESYQNMAIAWLAGGVRDQPGYQHPMGANHFPQPWKDVYAGSGGAGTSDLRRRLHHRTLAAVEDIVSVQ